MLSNEQENNKLLRNLPIHEILQERRSRNKQEQIRERVCWWDLSLCSHCLWLTLKHR